MEVIQKQYKDTKIGRIPKDWDVIKLGETCEFHRGQSFAKSEIDNNGENECIHYGQLFTVYSEIIRKIYSKTNSEVVQASECGDLLMPSSDVTPTGLATASVINSDGILIGGDVNIIRPIIELDSNFLSYLINHEKKKIIRLISGTNVKHIYNRNLKTLLYALPPLLEQQKIAKILSTVDEQISTTQTIIDKCKELKKGLMQKLFSEGIGHTEFKDTKIGRIPKGWEVVLMKSICEIKGGYSFKSALFKSEGNYQVLRIGNLYGGKLDLDRSPVFIDSIEKQYEDFLLKENDLISTMTGTVGKRDFGFIVKIDKQKNLLLNQRVCRMRATDIDSNFLYYSCSTNNYLDQFFLQATGGTGNQANIGTSHLGKIKISLPSINEQKKIAEILSEAYAKIEKEEKLKAQLEQLKKGLMQQLLTSKKRVKV